MMSIPNKRYLSEPIVLYETEKDKGKKAKNEADYSVHMRSSLIGSMRRSKANKKQVRPAILQAIFINQ